MQIFAYIVLIPALASFAVAAVIDTNPPTIDCGINNFCPRGYCCSHDFGVRFMVSTLVRFNMFTYLLSDSSVASVFANIISELTMDSVKGK